jgi:hypothetical protein
VGPRPTGDEANVGAGLGVAFDDGRKGAHRRAPGVGRSCLENTAPSPICVVTYPDPCSGLMPGFSCKTARAEL